MKMADGTSSITTHKKYDVFISFRGEDTRYSFTGHLYAALCRKQIKAYMDDNDLKIGDEISPALLSAIEESELCLVILSQNYASSTWCLEELVHILQCKGKNTQDILPVFYKVDPSHVREQEKSFADAFVKLEERFKDNMDKVQAWRDALTKVGHLSGWASTPDRYESKLIDVVVEEIIKKLNGNMIRVPSDDLKNLVGIDESIEQIKALLDIGSLDVRIVGIWGVGGIGKTTLALAVFNRFSIYFEACCFFESVREESKRHGQYHLEKRLFSELLENENVSMDDRYFARKRLQRKTVLIVFDDVDDPDQLEQLVGDWFGSGSRIIITSRDMQVLRNIGVDESAIYQVEGLNDEKAFQLFCMHALRKNSFTPDKIELSKKVVGFVGGIPLALKVLGRRLYSKSTEEWESTLNKLQKVLDKDILSVLKISYDALDENEKDIFLDIACFFKGKHIDSVKGILDGCDFYATAGISVLIDRCLITLDYYGDLCMHDMIQMMAFAIIRTKSMDEPRKGTRLWTADEVYRALKYNRGTDAIEGIYLDTTNFNEEVHLSPTTFANMCQLRLLIISNGRKLSLSQGPPLFPYSLRYLSWNAYPLKSLSTNFTAKKFVELDMRGSQLEHLWDGVVYLENLKSINLSCSRHLTQLPDLSQAPNIESIDLNVCDRLAEVPSYFQHLNKVKELELIGCSSLSNIARLPKKLKRLYVFTSSFGEKRDRYYGDDCPCSQQESRRRDLLKFHDPRGEICSKLDKFPEILEPMESLEIINLDYTVIKGLPSSIEHLIGLKSLSLRGCENLEFLPNTIHKLNSLEKLSLVDCRKLKSLPVLPLSLTYLNANGCTSLETVSSSTSRTLLIKQNWDDVYFINFKTSYRAEVFSFVDCHMLDENARKILTNDAQFKILRFATLYSKYGVESMFSYKSDSHETLDALQSEYFECTWPGSEIPGWFNHQSEGSSIRINLSPCVDEWYNSNYLGLAICLAFESDGCLTYDDSVTYESLYMSPDGDFWRQSGRLTVYHTRSDTIASFCKVCSRKTSSNFYLDDRRTELTGESVVLYYDCSLGNFLHANREKFIRFMATSTATATATASFTFKHENENVKVKKCGVHLLYAQDAEKYGFVEPYNWEETQRFKTERYNRIHRSNKKMVREHVVLEAMRSGTITIED